MPTVIEDDGFLIIQEKMTGGRRAFFALLALFPLIAPYELLLRPKWSSIPNPIFLLSLVISLGAIFLSGFLLFAAVAGLSTRLSFDRPSRTFSYSRQAPIVPYRRVMIPFDSIEKVDLEKHDWSEGEPSYSLKVHLQDGRQFKSASFSTFSEAEVVRKQAEELIRP